MCSIQGDEQGRDSRPRQNGGLTATVQANSAERRRGGLKEPGERSLSIRSQLASERTRTSGPQQTDICAIYPFCGAGPRIES